MPIVPRGKVHLYINSQHRKQSRPKRITNKGLWQFRGELIEGFLEEMAFGLTLEERFFMDPDEVERAFQKEVKGVSMGTEPGMSKSQGGKGEWSGMVQAECVGRLRSGDKILKGLDCPVREFGLTLPMIASH